MKKFLSLFLLACMLFTCLIACDNTDVQKDSDSEDAATEPPMDTSDTEANTEADSGDDSGADSESETDAPTPTGANLYAGYARACITPDWSVRLDGYGDIRYSTEVLDDLYASCTAVKDKDGNVILFYDLDMHFLYENNATKLRKLIAGEVGVAAANIFLSCSHSHTSPLETEIMDMLEEKLVEIAKLAIDDLTPCKIYGGINEVEEMNFVRRHICADGTLYGSGTNSPIVGHESEGDHQMLMLKFKREGKKDIVFVNWAAHTDSIVSTGKRTSISSDWVGPAREYVEKRNDAYLSTFIGAAGDMGTISYVPGEGNWQGYVQYGLDLGKIIEEQLKDGLKEFDTSKGIKVTSNKVRLQVNKDYDHIFNETEECLKQYDAGDTAGALKGLEALGVTYEDARRTSSTHWMNDYVRVELSAVSIGDVGFAVAPYEMFSGTGLEIKAASEFDLTFICAYTNGKFGYIPTAAAIPNGGYGVHNALFYPGTGEQLGGVLVELLSEIHG